MTVPRIPIAKPFLGEDEARSAFETVLSGWVTQGPRVAEFEEKFAAFVGARYAVAVSNCTAALHLALLTAGVRPGDEVVCPSHSFIATANAVLQAGARPVFADVGERTYNLDPALAERAISSKTRAILVVHQMGFPADLDAFAEIARRRGVRIVEDAACAAGSEYKSRRIGSHGELVCFSFHPRKVITTGDGGMITTSDPRHRERLMRLRHQGMSVSDLERHVSTRVVLEGYPEPGFNYRMTDIQAAVGVRQLEKLARIVDERRRVAKRYVSALAGVRGLRLPAEPEGCRANYQSFPVFLEADCPMGRDALMQRLLDRGIATRPGIMNAHETEAYRKLFPSPNLPVSEALAARGLLLPLYVPMKDEDVDYVVAMLREALEHPRAR